MKISKKNLIDKIIKNKILVVSLFLDEKKWTLLKNGSRTPFFLDTSKFQSFPEIAKEVNNYLANTIKKNNLFFDKILGIPYGGFIFSYGAANILKTPCLSIRKEGVKNYSTSGEILGFYELGDRVLLIEDATVTACTAIEFIRRIRKEGLLISDIITIVDVGESAKNNLKKEDVKLHSLFTWRELYEYFINSHSKSLSDEMKIILDRIIYK
jgi:orotate phosphoribosyltransferase